MYHESFNAAVGKISNHGHAFQICFKKDDALVFWNSNQDLESMARIRCSHSLGEHMLSVC